MEPRQPPEYILEIFADPTHVKDIVKGTLPRLLPNKTSDAEHMPGILHTIFFHRYFPSIRPSSLEVLDLTLPLVVDPELENLVDTRVAHLIRQLSSTTSPNSSVRGQIAVQFFEKKRRKGGGLGWFGGKGEEEVCWEVWMVEVTLAMPRTEAGEWLAVLLDDSGGALPVWGRMLMFLVHGVERTKVLKAMEMTLQKTAMKIVTIVNQFKDHIPPITTSESNPFPYQIVLNPRSENWGTRIGIF